MKIFQDPIILGMLVCLAICMVTLIYPRRKPEFTWLFIMTVMLFALPRAGIMVHQLRLPLPFAHVLAVLAIAGWFLLGKRWHHDHTHFGNYFLLYAAATGLGLIIGLGTGGNYKIAFIELFFYLISLGLFFVASDTFATKRHFYVFIGLFLTISVLVSLYGIGQKFLGSSILIDNVTYNSASDLARSYVEVDGDQGRRILSSYGDPNVLAAQLIVFAGVALALLVSPKTPYYLRILSLGILIVNVYCTYTTGSRGGLLGLIIVAMVVMIWRSRLAIMLIPVLVIMFFGFGTKMVETSLNNRFSKEVSIGDVRHELPAMTMQLLQQYPLGCGLGNQMKLEKKSTGWFFSIKPSANVWSGFNSYWVNLFSRLGILGLLTFIALIYNLYKYIYNQSKHISDPIVKAVLVGSVAGFIGQGLIWLVNNTYILPGGSLNFWFMMGMMIAGCRAFNTRQSPEPMIQPVQPTWDPTTGNIKTTLS